MNQGTGTDSRPKQIRIDYLEKMTEIASEQYGIDIKKTQTPYNQKIQRTKRKNELFTKFSI